MTIPKHRTTFPGRVDFTGWYVLSKKGCVAQLKKVGRTLREDNLYSLVHEGNGQTGNGVFLIQDLVNEGRCIVRRERTMLNKTPTDSMSMAERTLERAKHRCYGEAE